jgi:hypothetical protein
MTEETTMSDSEKKKEDWMNSKWRPAMGWLYMLVCFCDFVLFPVLWSILHAIIHTSNIAQWQPLTLQGAGLFHLAMGAVLGLAAYGRTQEKIAGANNGGLALPSNVGTTYTPPAAAPYTPPAASTYTPPPAVPAYKPAPAVTPTVTASSTGKAMPTPQVDEPL